ncbi:MAG: immunoglobulin domain-containing protein [Nibricoccus sp.]
MQTLKKIVGPLVLVFATLLARVPAQAATQTVEVGKSVTISVSADGAAPFSYQWKKDGVNITGATNASYTIASASTSSAGVYTATVSNSYGSTVSDNAVIAIGSAAVTAPTITTQPVALTVVQGSAATFSVAASGTSLSYQWKKSGVAISGATNSSYTISNTTLADAGSYSVTVSNTAGTATSLAVALTVNAVAVAPTITTQPTSLTVAPGASANFSVVASGSSLSYQWSKNGVAISGATNSSCTIGSATTSDAASYSVRVSNSAGAVTSSTATLTVSASVTAPSITTQPAPLTVTQGSAATFSVAASGSSLNYQWYKGSVPVANGTGSSVTLPAVTSADAGSYYVIVSNSAGTAVSLVVGLTVNAAVVTAPTIATQPASLTVTQGAAATFTVAANGTSLNYQWYKNGVAISGATTISYTLASTVLSSAGSYTVVVSNTAGSVTSSAATLTVNAPVTAPAITAQPTPLTVAQGGSALFSVTATGSSLSYQWYKGGTALSGGTSSSFTIGATSLSDAGNYYVMVSNSAGTVTSSVVGLTVNAAVTTAPAITKQPTAVTATAGSAATFTVTASGTPLNYQWYKGGAALAGATSATYTIGATASSDAGNYYVIVSNSAGTAVSLVVPLTVSAASAASPDFAELTPTSYTARGQNSAAEAVSMLFDGKTTTKWVDNSAFTWVQLTFASPTTLEAYSLTSAADTPGRDPVSWTLSGSNDGVTWNVIDTRSAETWATRQLTRDFVLATTSAAYTQFRFNFNALSATVTQLAEIEMHGSTVVSAKLTPSTYSARGQAGGNYAVAKLFDGSASTRWADYSAASWIKVGTSAPTILRRYTLTSSSDSANSDPIAWTLYGSNDGTNWTVIETRTGQSWSSRKLKRDFTLTTASNKYVWFRFDFQVASGWTTTQLAEMELFGQQ